MPKVKTTTTTDIKIASFFNTTTQTLRNWKKSEDKKLNNRYLALKEFYKREFNI